MEISLHSRTWLPDFVPYPPNPFWLQRLGVIHHPEAAISASAWRARSLSGSRRVGGPTYEGIERPNPNVAEDNRAAWDRCKPQTDVLPPVHAPATTAVHGPCPSRTPPLCADTLPQCVAPWRNMEGIPLWLVGSVRFSVWNGRTRASIAFGQKSSRCPHMTHRGFRRYDMPFLNIRAAHPSRRWAESPPASWLADTPSLRRPMLAEQPAASSLATSPVVPNSHPHSCPGAREGARHAGPEPGIVFFEGPKPGMPSRLWDTPFESRTPTFRRRTTPEESRL